MSISLTQPSKMACRTLTLAALLFGRRGFPDVWLRKNSRRPSKRHLVAPFQLKDVPCLVGRGDLLAKSFYNLAHLGDLFRSEEHTSELQSLMRISYAVFCLKKKNTHINTFYQDTMLITEDTT